MSKVVDNPFMAVAAVTQGNKEIKMLIDDRRQWLSVIAGARLLAELTGQKEAAIGLRFLEQRVEHPTEVSPEATSRPAPPPPLSNYPGINAWIESQ